MSIGAGANMGPILALVPFSIVLVILLAAWFRFTIQIIQLSIGTTRDKEMYRRKMRRSLIAFTGVSVMIVGTLLLSAFMFFA